MTIQQPSVWAYSVCVLQTMALLLSACSSSLTTAATSPHDSIRSMPHFGFVRICFCTLRITSYRPHIKITFPHNIVSSEYPTPEYFWDQPKIKAEVLAIIFSPLRLLLLLPGVWADVSLGVISSRVMPVKYGWRAYNLLLCQFRTRLCAPHVVGTAWPAEPNQRKQIAGGPSVTHAHRCTSWLPPTAQYSSFGNILISCWTFDRVLL